MKSFSKKHFSKNPEETWKIAKEFSKTLSNSAVRALHGDLGAGKTCFIQGLAQGLGIKEPITSPTYTLIDEYTGKKNLVHMDLYRLSNSLEAIGIGLEEYFNQDSIIAIEWAERAEDLLPKNIIHVNIEYAKNPLERSIEISKKEDLCG